MAGHLAPAKAARAARCAGRTAAGVDAEPFLHSLAINILSPKVVLFVLALMSQFVDPRVESTAPQMLVLGTVLIVVALIIDTCYAFASGTVGAWLRHHPRASHRGDRISSLVYLVLGIAVAVTDSG